MRAGFIQFTQIGTLLRNNAFQLCKMTFLPLGFAGIYKSLYLRLLIETEVKKLVCLLACYPAKLGMHILTVAAFFAVP